MGVQGEAASSFRIRTFAREDHKVVCDLFHDGLIATYCRDGENEHMRDYAQRSLTRELADIEDAYLASGGHFWVATVPRDDDAGEQVVGCVGLQVGEDNRGKLRRLAIHGDFRRRGIAQKLVEEAEQWCRERGLRGIDLDTFREMVPAIKLYEAMGYTRTKEAPFRWYPKVWLVFFEKEL